jgi:hypothetical protein
MVVMLRWVRCLLCHIVPNSKSDRSLTQEKYFILIEIRQLKVILI